MALFNLQAGPPGIAKGPPGCSPESTTNASLANTDPFERVSYTKDAFERFRIQYAPSIGFWSTRSLSISSIGLSSEQLIATRKTSYHKWEDVDQPEVVRLHFSRIRAQLGLSRQDLSRNIKLTGDAEIDNQNNPPGVNPDKLIELAGFMRNKFDTSDQKALNNLFFTSRIPLLVGYAAVSLGRAFLSR